MRSANADSPALAPTQPASPLRLFVLGAFRLERDGATIHLPTRKAESLLAYLALHPEPQAREKLAALFWGDSPDELARRSLRTALASLRKELGDEIIVADRESVQLNPANQVWVDVIEFQQQAAEFLASDSPDATTTAINFDLYRGDLLADCYDDWIVAERERMQALYLDALLRTAQRLREHSEYARAIEMAHKVLAVDPSNEPAHQHAMFCHWSLGDRSAALKQFDECQRALHDELGVEPSPDTLALHERIKQASLAGPSPATANTNLPIPLTSFIGREREIATVNQLLGSTRLLTLTGVGGCGKTRLAIQVAREMVDQFADGVWWVELAAAREDERVLQLVVKALGLVESQQLSPLEALLNHLRTRHALLVVDNCEHLIKACAELAETLLSQCSQVRILTTSREALSISGEIAWLVPSLTVPAKEETTEPARLLQSESVRLFIERARAIQHDFALTPANAPTIARICRRLDGIPLAIELAAARIKALSVEQIDARLDDRFGLLTTGSRTALPRQQTLRATIDWSYALLSSAEQTLLRRLSVFSGGWTLEAAESVCAGGEVERAQVLDLLTHLTEKSLLIAVPQANETRFDMLETIRQYAHERLLEFSEIEPMRDQHLMYFLRLAERAEPELRRAAQVAWLDRLEAELDNIRAALEWSLERERHVEAGLRLATALIWLWHLRDHKREGSDWLERALSAEARTQDAETPSNTRTLTRAQALNAAGFLMDMQGNHAKQVTLVREGLALSRELGDTGKRSTAFALWILADAAYAQQNYGWAQTLFEESLALYQALGDKFGAAECLLQLGELTLVGGDYEHARGLQEELLALRKEIGDRDGMATAYLYLGEVAFWQGDLDQAAAAYEAGLALFNEVGDKSATVWALSWLAGVFQARGDYEEAVRQSEQALTLIQDVGDRRSMAGTLYDLGQIEWSKGEYGEAARYYEEALTLIREVGEKSIIADVLCSLGHVSLIQGDDEQATRRFEEALAIGRDMEGNETIADALFGLGRAAQARNDFTAARSLHIEALTLRRGTHGIWTVAFSLDALAAVAGAQGQARRAARLFGAAETQVTLLRFVQSPFERDAHERAVATARSQLDEAMFFEAWAEGRAMTLEQAVEEAMRV